MDRIDIHVDVPSVKYRDLADENAGGERSADIAVRIGHARVLQEDRYRSYRGLYANAGLEPRLIQEYCHLDSAGERLVERAIDSFGFSGRAYHRILKVARTIADLEESPDILSRHVAEAVQYRTLDRNLWLT